MRTIASVFSSNAEVAASYYAADCCVGVREW